MASLLRQMQAEWNALVPQAIARGIPRVRMLNAPLETIAYRSGKLAWLKDQLQVGTAPTTQSLLTYGVELEFLMPDGMSREELAGKIMEAGVTCSAELYGHNTLGRWKLVTDGSLGDYARGAELVSPVLRGQEGLDQLRIACKVLSEAKCKITKKCGMHVHIGAADESVDFFRNLVRLYAAAEPVIDQFVAPSRRGASNMYCKPVNPQHAMLANALSVDGVVQALGQSIGRHSVRSANRYCKLNLQSFWQHGTVEFRQHQGTVDPQKACNWVQFCIRMAQAAKQGVTLMAPTEDDLMTAIEATQGEREYFHSRAVYFLRRAS